MSNLFNGNYGSVSFDKLIADTTHPIDIKGVTIASGQGKLKRGTVLGKVTATGKSVIVNSANANGSQTADCILADDVDATSADVVAQAYQTGTFNRAALVFGGTDTYATHETVLRQLGIFLKYVQS